jgi:hypothetical protein
MRKASEMKAAQMKDKRRAWEASPEFMKNTMTFDKDESYVKMRESASVAEKIAFAEPIKDEGNDLFAKGKYAQAMAKYTAAVAVFRYWNRTHHGNEQNIVKHYDDEALSGDERTAAHGLIRSIYLNAAQCMKKGNMADGSREIIWTCTEVLEIDPDSAKAYYRRAMAHAESDTFAHTGTRGSRPDPRQPARAQRRDDQARAARAQVIARHAARQGQGCLRRRVQLEGRFVLGGGEKRRGGRIERFIAGEVRGEPDKRRRGPGAYGVPEHVGARAQGSV